MPNSLHFEQLQVMPCRHGLMVWPRQDETIGRALELYGEFAEGENRVMARYVAAGDWVVDVGANLGTTALPLARAVGARGQVLAFEPQPLMAQCLQTTLSLNECFHVRVITSGLAETAGWARIPAPGIAQRGNYGAVGLGPAGLPVPVMRLDDLDLETCALVKIDVEGFEWQVIQGAQGHLLRHRPVLYLEAKRTPGTVACLDWLMRQGWQCYWHFAFFFRTDNFRQNHENAFGGTGDMNVLAVPAQRPLPQDLPLIRAADEDWRTTYAAFFQHSGRVMP